MQLPKKRWTVLAGALLVWLVFHYGSSAVRPQVLTTSTPAMDEDADEDACDPPIIPSAYADALPPGPSVGGDIVPIRSVQDTYPSLHSVSVDPAHDLVVMSDSNRGNLLFYPRDVQTSPTTVTVAERDIRGPHTGMMFIAGVALDPDHQEVFTVDNDIGDRMLVFPYGVEGNVKPKRVLSVPHGSWGVALYPKRDEVAISVEHINTIVVYKRDADGKTQPLRTIHGVNTGLADPHGIAVDERDNEFLVASHGNWAPLTREEANTTGNKGGRWDMPSIRTFDATANGDVKPARVIEGKNTRLNWPMGLSYDPVNDEVAVANYGDNSILVFKRNASGDVAPVREIRGDRTGILGPMGVALDARNGELWVTNYRDHSAVVFSRTANGNVAPKRVLRNAPPGTPAVGFGNPGAVAYDSKREEILVPN